MLEICGWYMVADVTQLERSNQSFEFHFGDRSGLVIGTEYSSTGMCQCTVLRLCVGYIYIYIYIVTNKKYCYYFLL